MAEVNQTVSLRYAKALFDLADKAKQTEEVASELSTLNSALQSDEGQLFGALCNPVFTIEERQAVLGLILDKLKTGGLTTNLARLLLDKGRIANLPAIASAYQAQADDRTGRINVTVETAEPLSAQLEGEIRAALEGTTKKSVILNTTINSELIGGMVVRVGSKVYDASIRNKLDRLKQHLLSSPLTAEA